MLWLYCQICAECSPKIRTLNLNSLHRKHKTLTTELPGHEQNRWSKPSISILNTSTLHISSGVGYTWVKHYTFTLWNIRHVDPTTRIFFSTRANDAILIKDTSAVLSNLCETVHELKTENSISDDSSYIYAAFIIFV